MQCWQWKQYRGVHKHPPVRSAARSPGVDRHYRISMPWLLACLLVASLTWLSFAFGGFCSVLLAPVCGHGAYIHMDRVPMMLNRAWSNFWWGQKIPCPPGVLAQLGVTLVWHIPAGITIPNKHDSSPNTALAAPGAETAIKNKVAWGTLGHRTTAALASLGSY